MSSDSGSSETILNFSMQVKTRFPLNNFTDTKIPQLKADPKNQLYSKNKYSSQVLLDNWVEDQLQFEDERRYLKLKRGPHETTYNMEYQVPYIEDLEAFNKSKKGKSRDLRSYLRSPTEYSINYRVKMAGKDQDMKSLWCLPHPRTKLN